MTDRRRVPLVVVLAAALLVVPATSAHASHVIRWGAGTDCASASTSASTTVDVPLRFVACVTRDGAPVAGHGLAVRVAGPARQVELDVETDAGGIARFAVQPTAAGETRVTLCDDDGCVYGETVVLVSGAPATVATTAPAVSTTGAADERDGGAPVLPILGGAAVVVALLVAGWGRSRRRLDVPIPPELDHALTRHDLRLLASLDADLLREAATAAGAAPAMAIDDHLEFFLADVHHRVDVAVHEQMKRIERLGGNGDVDAETARLKRLLEARVSVRDVRGRVADRVAAKQRASPRRD